MTADTLGRVGGLPRVVAGEDLETGVVLGFDKVEERGATGSVNGLFAGSPVLVLDGLVFSSSREGSVSAILMKN